MDRVRYVCFAFAVAGCSSSDAASTADASVSEASDAAIDTAPDSSIAADADGGTCALVRPYSSRNATCNACAEAKCCGEVNACLVDTDCDDGYVNCAIACAIDFDAGSDAAADAGPTACLADCARQYPKGKTEYDTAIGCVDRSCTAECK